jgi:CRISPR-associated protein Csx10
MGSVLVLKPAQPVSADRLRALEESGIGERRIDGFGRLVFNWQYLEKLSIEAPVRNEPAPKSIGGDALSKEVAQRMAERILRARMEVQLMAQAGRICVERAPGKTQLSRLRNIVLDELRQPKPTQITRGQETKSRIQWFLEDILKRQVTRDAWSRARVEPNGKPLIKWIKDVYDADVNNADEWRKAVGLRDEEVPKVKVGNDVSAELTAAMRREFSLRLIAEALRRAAKQQR